MKALNFSNYGEELHIRNLIGSRLINEEFPSEALLKSFCRFHKIEKWSDISEEEYRKRFKKNIANTIENKELFEDETKITKEVEENLEELFDYIINFQDFPFNRTVVFHHIARGLSDVDTENLKLNNVEFLDKVNESIEGKNLSPEELLGIYTGRIALPEPTPEDTPMLGGDINSPAFEDFSDM